MVYIYRIFHTTTRKYTLFSATHGTFSKIDHVLGHRASFNKFKETEITPCIISDHNGKYSNTWRLNITLIKDKLMTRKIRKEFTKFVESSENENTTYQHLWNIAKAMLRGNFTAISACTNKTETAHIYDLMMYLKLLGKEEQIKPQTSR
jgi:hypothetical protein